MQANNLIVTGSSRFLNKIQGTAVKADTADSATTAARLNNTAAIGNASSPVYFSANGVPVAINGAEITVNNATNASKTGGVAFGSLATVSTITSDMLPTHNHTTAQITNFTSAVDERITRDKILGTISTASSWTGSYAFVEGVSTTASGTYSHAEGYQTSASGGWGAHAEGSDTTASGASSHAEGENTIATGEASHAGGNGQALAQYAFAHGEMVVANKKNQFAIGQYNIPVDDALFIIGNGSEEPPVASNAMYVTTAGNGNFAGTVTAQAFKGSVDVSGDGAWTSATTSDGVVTVSHIGGLGSTGAAGPTGNTASSAIWGKSITVPYIAFDEHGHISTSVNRTVTFPSNPNTNTVSTLRGDYTYLKTGADVGVKQYSLIARDSEGYYQSFTSGSGTASSKAINRTTYFDISKIFYYGGSANVAANTNMSTATLYYAVANADLRYSLNIATSTLTARKPVYLIFDKTASTVGTNGTRCYKLAGTSTNDWFTQTLPTSADGNIYVEIGKGVRDYRNDLTIHQTYYEYTDWLRSYDSISALEDKVIASFAYNPFAPEYTCSIPYQTLIDDGYRWIRDGRLEAVLHSGNSESVCKNIKYDDTEDFDFVDFYFTDKILHYTSSGISAIDIPSIPEILDITITDNNGTLSCNKTFADIKAWIDQDGHYVDDIQAKVTFVSTSVNDYSVDSINYYQDNSYWRIDFYFARGSIAYYDDNDILYIANGSVGDNAHAEGIATIASGKTSHAEGSLTKATSTAAHAEGYLTTADGKYSHAEGSETIADSESAHAEGWYSKATSTAAHAEGYKTTASGKYAHAEGQLTKAEGFCAHTEGWYTYALGSYCHSEGDKTTASDSSTHAEGNLTIASTACSHAEGYKTTAAGAYSHTEGASTKATAISAHAEGNSTTASGKSSHAGGTFTIANADYQTAIGQYNATVADALFIVGNGTATNARSNAMYVTTAGNINCVSVTQTSDRRLKDNITNISTTDLAIYDKLQPKSFTLKSDDVKSKHYGFIAQDVLQSFKELGLPSSYVGIVHQDQNEQGYYNINYTELIALLVEKQKIMQQEIDELKAAVAALKQHQS